MQYSDSHRGVLKSPQTANSAFRFLRRLNNCKRVALFLLFTLAEPLSAPGSEPFHIGFDDWIGFAPFFVAAEKGFYDGVDVRFVKVTDEDERRAGLSSGRLQMLCETMGMYESDRKETNYDGKIVFALDESHGADVVLASGNIHSVKDLKEKIMAGQARSHSYLLLIAALARSGSTISDLSFLNVPIEKGTEAFSSGRANALCTYAPHISSAINGVSGARILLSSKDFPGVIVDVAIVRDDVISRRRNELEKIYFGWTRAVAYIRDNPEETSKILAGVLGLSMDEFKKMSAGVTFFGKEENESYFGVKMTCCESEAARIFSLMGRALLKNGLTTAVSAAGEQIDPSVVGSGLSK